MNYDNVVSATEKSLFENLPVAKAATGNNDRKGHQRFRPTDPAI
jgi:hypothetical protein